MGFTAFSGAAVYWLATLTFVAHMIEELPRFPAWATRHFGTTTTAFYCYSHVVVTAVVAAASYGAACGGGTGWVIFATLVQWALAVNAIFHLATTVLFREYSPGVITGTTLFLPATAYLVGRTLHDHALTGGELALAIALGTVVSTLIVASLWLDMNFDWRLRRTAR